LSIGTSLLVDRASTHHPSPGVIRVFPGPAVGEAGGDARWSTFLATTWTVGLDSDRRGLRLEPPAGAATGLGAAGDGPSQGVVVGAIQLTPSGHPLVLMPDGGVTGGYPVIGIVASADVPLLGQLTPGAAIHFASARVRLDE
jgi:allophanate hydrolase subunit 2